MATAINVKIAQPLPPFARAAFGVANLILGWEVRRSTRHKLSQLDDRLLADVGIDRIAASAEYDKPFWRD